MKKKLLIAFALVALIGGTIAYKMLTPSPDIDITKAKTELKINASNIYQSFFDDEVHANEEYAGKIVEVSGVLDQVEETQEGVFQISLNAENDMGKVICNLSEFTPAVLEKLKTGTPITVKGVCTGYLFDVVIDHGMIINS